MRYTKELLEDILKEANATLIGDYTKFNQRMCIRYRCSCGTLSEKRFEMLNIYRYPYCESCSLKLKEKKNVETCMKKYGVSNASKHIDIKNKINEVFLNKYGDHPKRTKEVQEKWVTTCLEKYGGHPNQNVEVQAKAEKNSYIHKDYMLPSGDVIKLQGYEPFALDDLLQKYEETDIIIGRGNVPRIQYISNGIKRVYFPDFYIKSTNTIIEIKSEWTLQLTTCRLSSKAEAVIKEGYKYEVLVYGSNKKCTRAISF
jgi:predicted nuclease of restriction endonuclease-like RecB superfamily